MPDRLKLLIGFLIFSGSCMSPALVIKGRTHNGMTFTGSACGIVDAVLQISTKSNENPLQIGIPLEDISAITIFPENDGGVDLLAAIDSLPTLLPVLDSVSIEHLLKAIRARAKAKDWQSAFLWSSKLALLNGHPQLMEEVALFKAWALYELKIFNQARTEAATLTSSIDPLSAPARLCWINAHLAYRTGDLEQSQFWALLPSLQIPSRDDPLVRELVLWTESLESSSTNQSHP